MTDLTDYDLERMSLDDSESVGEGVETAGGLPRLPDRHEGLDPTAQRGTPSPRLPCCRPTAYSGGGYVLVHSPTCDRADQPLTPDEVKVWKAQVRELPRADVKTAVKEHPAKGRSPWTVWMSHPYGCTCEPCRYVDAHLDDGR